MAPRAATTDSLQLEERAALLRETESIAGVGSYLWEPGNPPIWTDGMFRILGYEPGAVEPSAEAFHTRVHPDDRDRVLAAHRAAHEGRLPDVEYRILRANDGEERNIRGTGRIHFDEGASMPRRIFGALLDITEQKRGALRDERTLATMRHAERLAQMGSFVVDLEPLATVWSQGLYDLLGHDGDADESTWLRFMHPDDREAQVAWFQALMRDGEAPPIQSRYYRADGELRYGLTHAAPVRFESDGSRRIVGATIDVTDRVQLEERLRHVAKMEAVGTLAAGVAHDFNNYLMVIQGCFSMLSRTPNVPEELLGLTEQARHAALRCMELTQQMLAFARRRPARRELVRLDELLGRIGTLVSPSLGKGIELVVSVPPTAVHAMVDPAHLEQVIVNLAFNGRDAIHAGKGDGGSLEISVEAVKLEAPQQHAATEIGAGRWACIHVKDDGAGIAAEHLSRIFEPYFTTKAVGRGTGLGLAAAYGAAQQHGGHITVRSAPGQGSCFTVWLPEAESQEQPPTAPRTGKAPEGATRRVLVVDDMPAVRAVTSISLRAAGYDVVEAVDGVDALGKLEEGRFDVVLSDLRMPRMGGLALAERVAVAYPDLSVILMTGYADDAPADGGLTVLEKPVTLDELVRAVEAAANGPVARADGQ